MNLTAFIYLSKLHTLNSRILCIRFITKCTYIMDFFLSDSVTKNCSEIFMALCTTFTSSIGIVYKYCSI